MIKIIDTDSEDIKRISIDGVLGKESYVYVSQVSESLPSCYIHDEMLRDKILKISINEILKKFDSLSIEVDVENFYSSNFKLTSPTRRYRGNKSRIELYVDSEEWKEIYSLKEFSEALETVSSYDHDNIVNYFRDDEEFITNGFGFECEILDYSRTIEAERTDLISAANDLIFKAKKLLSESSGRLTLELNFPDEIRTPCEQYLMYFSQYLLDLGISTSSEINHVNNSTIFSVIPEDKEQALEVIADSLACYLSLPDELEHYTSQIKNKDISLMQLESNVFHLKSQLMLAQSVLEAKNATIQSLTLTNEQYERLLSAKQTADSNPTKEVAVIGEVVKVKEYKGKIVTIDIPRVISNLKRIIRKK